MKIGQKPELPSPVTQQAQAKAQAKAATAASEELAKNAAPAQANAGVPVSMSNSARALDRASRNTSDFNADKVKAIRTAIENGTFSINAEAIADKMLAGAREMLVPGGV